MNERRFSSEIERLRAPERVERLEVARVVSLSLDGLTATSILDVGTGSGLFAEAFAAQRRRVAGVDLREDMLAAARLYVPGGEFRQAHMAALPYTDAAFDLVFLGLVLHEADNLRRALAEAYRVAVRRVVVLEWPYQTQEFGPPLEHRLPIAQITQTAAAVGFQRVTHQALTHLSLYQLDKPAEGQS
ncbi:MAG TPA: class I SAM-dependent methyltransferase [Phototrophicaceae bacterium]|nr:class I SAM-dependent methyltransferase [Phototrophicaceae bacterium]